MKRWAALVTVLAFSALAPRMSAAQSNPSGPAKVPGSGSELGQNSPNPFTVDTKIPFTLGDYPTCSDQSRVYHVTLKIYNIISQLVAIPVLQGGAGSVADGAPLDDVELPCGQYTAYWDAKNTKTGQQVPKGVYLYRLEVDGKPATKKMYFSGPKPSS